ncbi:hypothetical protein QIH87_16510 [Bradyrhizobium elkanii]|uniref:Uncharacterized protein n=1 Tax=Bradyrhizobium elkanii TaxID=29448 RepID=A0ABV4F633_BRAEL|nr:hypothetical protein [Bradyrhizobium elkanii]MBP2433715.1 hypothetical protein [Bradyrhizobium elkanii]MCP1750480.1 hypothetical protein [Bradyrhizobium elkanii]MCP1976256.1 hypothetical protein [Bradyrhizobium elkanii]MCS3889228.1 hypothetical protein [Bradyrhizobium elkanii]MCS4211751.1 hypothetical protein [Bradyrhizobium elkanii]
MRSWGASSLRDDYRYPPAAAVASSAASPWPAVAVYAGKAKEQTIAEFLLNIIPNTVIDAFAHGCSLRLLCEPATSSSRKST